MWGSFLVATTVTAVSAVLSLFTGYAFGTMRFRGSGLLFNLIVIGLIFPYEATVIPLYYDFLNYHPRGHQPRGLVLGADPAADRAVGHAGHVLDARVLPHHAEGAGRGRPHRRRRLVPDPAQHPAARRRGRRCSRSACSSSSTPGTSSCWRSCCSHGSDNTTAPLGLSFFAGVSARGRSDQGRRGLGARGRADPDRLPVPAAALHPRRARRRDQGVTRRQGWRPAQPGASGSAYCSNSMTPPSGPSMKAHRPPAPVGAGGESTF